MSKRSVLPAFPAAFPSTSDNSTNARLAVRSENAVMARLLESRSLAQRKVRLTSAMSNADQARTVVIRFSAVMASRARPTNASDTAQPIELRKSVRAGAMTRLATRRLVKPTESGAHHDNVEHLRRTNDLQHPEWSQYNMLESS